MRFILSENRTFEDECGICYEQKGFTPMIPLNEFSLRDSKRPMFVLLLVNLTCFTRVDDFGKFFFVIEYKDKSSGLFPYSIEVEFLQKGTIIDRQCKEEIEMLKDCFDRYVRSCKILPPDPQFDLSTFCLKYKV